MAEYENLSGLFTGIADAIREKTGNEELIQAEAFPEAIAGIPEVTDVNKSAAAMITKTITEYDDAEEQKIAYVASSAFIDCEDLEWVNFPVCSIVSMWAFYNCAKLSSVTIGAATELENYAFRACENLMTVVLPGDSVADIFQYTFSSTPIALSSYHNAFGSVYVPASLVSDYQSAKWWSNYKSRITAIE